MLWPSDKYDVAFSKIVEDALSGGSTILILRRIRTRWRRTDFERLLKAEDVQFQVKPVGGYDDLLAHEDIVRAEVWS